MKKGIVYPIQVHSDNGKRIISKHTKTHVQRLGTYTPKEQAQ